jgi:hypothetical protein
MQHPLFFGEPVNRATPLVVGMRALPNQMMSGSAN